MAPRPVNSGVGALVCAPTAAVAAAAAAAAGDSPPPRRSRRHIVFFTLFLRPRRLSLRRRTVTMYLPNCTALCAFPVHQQFLFSLWCQVVGACRSSLGPTAISYRTQAPGTRSHALNRGAQSCACTPGTHAEATVRKCRGTRPCACVNETRNSFEPACMHTM